MRTPKPLNASETENRKYQNRNVKKLNYSGIPIKGNENWFEKSGRSKKVCKMTVFN